ncbi:MAG: glyoxalase superfamily protein [Acidobacteriaceae bacterium]
MISKVKFATIYVSDQERSLAFYRDKLGFKVTTDATFGPPGQEMRWLELEVAGQDTKVILFKDPEKIGGFSPVVFAASDVLKTYEELSARGVEYVGKPKQESWGWSSMFKDPDATIFMLGSDT